MKLKINSMYKTKNGYLVPRSHLSSEKGIRWAVIELLNYVADGRYYAMQHVTLDTPKIKELLELDSKERIDII